VSQIDVKADIGLTFANGLRAILRQDPNIVMVGEIRDFETAEIAIRAAMTGHLVFSTLQRRRERHRACSIWASAISPRDGGPMFHRSAVGPAICLTARRRRHSLDYLREIGAPGPPA
jgi:hypothetical protein